jgi:hypothetical protein
MIHQPRPIRVRADICKRLKRLTRGARTPVQDLVNAILRDFVDEFTRNHQFGWKHAPRRSWRRR